MGNWKGWSLAAVILVIEAVLVIAAFKLDDLSRPTAFASRPELFQPLTLPVAPSTVVPMNEAGDAGPLYREAIADYLARAVEYAKLEAEEEPHLERFKAFGLLARAGKMKTGSVLAPWMTDVVRFGRNERTPLVRVEDLGKLLIALANKAQERGKPADARALFETAFALGAKLWDERLVHQEADLGLKLMGDAAAGLAVLASEANDAPRAAAAQAFLDARSTFIQEQLWPTWKVLADAEDASLREHAGDAFVMASDRMQERMWRVEAIFKLGYLRYNVGGGRRGDQVGATRITAALAEKDPDPIVKQAAKVASELTESDWRRR